MHHTALENTKGYLFRRSQYSFLFQDVKGLTENPLTHELLLSQNKMVLVSIKSKNMNCSDARYKQLISLKITLLILTSNNHFPKAR